MARYSLIRPMTHGDSGDPSPSHVLDRISP